MSTISWSKAKTWRRCHKSYDYKYNQRLAPKRQPLPLLRGVILHEMLDYHARGENPFARLDNLAKVHRQLILDDPETYGTLIEDCLAIIEGYFRTYPEDSSNYEVISTEQAIDVPLTTGIRFNGFIDKILLEKKYNRRWLVDHKSHKNLPNEEARFSDLQLAFYVWAYNISAPPGQRIDGILWDYLRTKTPTMPELLKSGQLSKRANIDTDLHTYLKAIKINQLNPADYSDILKDLENKPSNFYERVFLPTPPKALIESSVEDMKNTALEIEYLGKVSHTRNLTKDCSWCSFYDLCHAELRGLDADFVRKAKFTTKETDHDGDEEILND